MTTTVKTSIKEFIAQRLPEYQELALDIQKSATMNFILQMR